MENSITRKEIWDNAAKAGLVFGGVSILYFIISVLMPTTQSIAVGALISLFGIVLWAAKFFGCIWLMKHFMKKLVKDHPDAMNSDTFRFGTATALLSALIFSAFYLLYTTMISPDTFTEALEMVKESYSTMMPAESLQALEEMNFATYGFFAQLIYCFIYGTVLSSILSRNIPSTDPFEDYKPNDNQ